MKNTTKKKQSRSKELGASLVECGLLIALIAVIAIPSLRALGDQVNVTTNLAKDAFGAQGHITGGCPISNPDC